MVQQLQPRDHVIAALLVEHRTLTTGQLAAVLFDSASTARARLYRLRRLGWVDRFTPVRTGQPRQTHWVPGLLAARYHAVQHASPAPTPRTWRDRVEATAASTHLRHTTGANQVFIDLLAHTRTHPQARLARWWGPARTAAALGQRVHPDGHGVWADHHHDNDHRGHESGQGRQVGFWLEYDTGTEPLHRLVAKLAPYARLRRAGGPDYPVLFHLPTPTREANLHDRLASHAAHSDGDGGHVGVLVATTTPDAVATGGLTGPAWRLVGRNRPVPAPRPAQQPRPSGSVPPRAADPGPGPARPARPSRRDGRRDATPVGRRRTQLTQPRLAGGVLGWVDRLRSEHRTHHREDPPRTRGTGRSGHRPNPAHPPHRPVGPDTRNSPPSALPAVTGRLHG